MQHGFTYDAVLTASHKANWQIDDILGPDRALDFTRPFLPDSLAYAEQLDFLDAREKLLLNQIRGHGYLYLFGLVEEFILPFVLDHIRGRAGSDDVETRALLGFAAEEAKHIDLFKRFRTLFLRDFPTSCAVIGPPEAVAKEVLKHTPLAVALIILHIEWMTQRHYLDSIRGATDLDSCFTDLLRYHWMEEAQHAKLDTLLVEELARQSSAADIEAAIDGYLAIVAFLAGGLQQQVEFDLASFEDAAGRRFNDGQRQALRAAQQAAMNWTFIGSGMTHDTFQRIVGAISATGARHIAAIARSYC